MENDVRPWEEHLYKCGDEMIPTIGDVCLVLVRQRVKVLSINDDNTANVALIPETPLPDGIVVIMNGVPFKYISADSDDK